MLWRHVYWLREQSCVWTKIYIHVANFHLITQSHAMSARRDFETNRVENWKLFLSSSADLHLHHCTQLQFCVHASKHYMSVFTVQSTLSVVLVETYHLTSDTVFSGRVPTVVEIAADCRSSGFPQMFSKTHHLQKQHVLVHYLLFLTHLWYTITSRRVKSWQIKPQWVSYPCCLFL